MGKRFLFFFRAEEQPPKMRNEESKLLVKNTTRSPKTINLKPRHYRQDIGFRLLHKLMHHL